MVTFLCKQVQNQIQSSNPNVHTALDIELQKNQCNQVHKQMQTSNPNVHNALEVELQQQHYNITLQNAEQ